MKPVKLYEEFHDKKKHQRILGQNPGLFGLAQYCYDNYGSITGEHANRDEEDAVNHRAIQDLANYYEMDRDNFQRVYTQTASGSVLGSASAPAPSGSSSSGPIGANYFTK